MLELQGGGGWGIFSSNNMYLQTVGGMKESPNLTSSAYSTCRVYAKTPFGIL